MRVQLSFPSKPLSGLVYWTRLPTDDPTMGYDVFCVTASGTRYVGRTRLAGAQSLLDPLAALPVDPALYRVFAIGTPRDIPTPASEPL